MLVRYLSRSIIELTANANYIQQFASFRLFPIERFFFNKTECQIKLSTHIQNNQYCRQKLKEKSSRSIIKKKNKSNLHSKVFIQQRNALNSIQSKFILYIYIYARVPIFKLKSYYLTSTQRLCPEGRTAYQHKLHKSI